MALKRKMLETMGLTTEQVDVIIENHTETVTGLKAEISTLKETDVAGVTKERDDWKLKHDALDIKLLAMPDSAKIQADFDAFKADTIAQASKLKINTQITDALKDANVNEKAIPLIMKFEEEMFNRLRMNDTGIVQGLTESVAKAVETHSAFIPTQVGTEGVKVNTMTQGAAVGTTKADLKKMNYGQMIEFKQANPETFSKLTE